jgi:hypothetical protein
VLAATRTNTTAVIYIGVGCVCASDTRGHAAGVVDARRTNAPPPQSKAGAPTPDARASGALPAP